jgi:hypothetical protein
LLISKLDEKYSHRNFALGTIYLSVSCSSDLVMEKLGSSREQCSRYFDYYHRKSACFGDLQSYVAGLSDEDKGKFMQHIASLLSQNEVQHSRSLSNYRRLFKKYFAR